MKTKKAAAYLLAFAIALLPVGAAAEQLVYDHDTFTSFSPLSPTVAGAVEFDLATAGAYSLDAVQFYLQAPAAGSYPLVVHVWDETLAEAYTADFTVAYELEGWYALDLAAAGLRVNDFFRVGVNDAASTVSVGGDLTAPLFGHGYTFDSPTVTWSPVTDVDYGIRADVTLVAPALSCQGFLPPLARTVRMRKGARNLPAKARLFDTAGAPVTNAGLVAAPVVKVFYAATEGADPVDVTAYVFPAGRSNIGTAFRFTDAGLWRYNLKTKGFVAPGIYSLVLASGNEAEYLVDPTCTAKFVISGPKPKKPFPPRGHRR